MYTIAIWPILVASVAAFAIGSIWYSPFLFGAEWMSLTKTTQADIDAVRARGGVWKSYLVQFIVTVVTFCVLGFIVASDGSITAADGAVLGAILWLGFVLPQQISGLLWKKEPFRLALLDTTNVLLTLVVGGAIIGGWR